MTGSGAVEPVRDSPGFPNQNTPVTAAITKPSPPQTNTWVERDSGFMNDSRPPTYSSPIANHWKSAPNRTRTDGARSRYSKLVAPPDLLFSAIHFTKFSLVSTVKSPFMVECPLPQSCAQVIMYLPGKVGTKWSTETIPGMAS